MIPRCSTHLLRPDFVARLRAAAAVASAALAALVLCACVGTPREHFYTLSPVAKAPDLAPPRGTEVRQITVGPITIPEIVDRPQLVVRRGANQVDILEQHRWAQSLATEIGGVVAANLSTLLPQVDVVPQDSPASTGADRRIAIEIIRFDAVPGEAVTVQARWTVRSPRVLDGKPQTAIAREPVRGLGEDALAAAFDRALARLSAEIAADLEQSSIFSVK